MLGFTIAMVLKFNFCKISKLSVVTMLPASSNSSPVSDSTRSCAKTYPSKTSSVSR